MGDRDMDLEQNFDLNQNIQEQIQQQQQSVNEQSVELESFIETQIMPNIKVEVVELGLNKERIKPELAAQLHEKFGKELLGRLKQNRDFRDAQALIQTWEDVRKMVQVADRLLEEADPELHPSPVLPNWTNAQMREHIDTLVHEMNLESRRSQTQSDNINVNDKNRQIQNAARSTIDQARKLNPYLALLIATHTEKSLRFSRDVLQFEREIKVWKDRKKEYYTRENMQAFVLQKLKSEQGLKELKELQPDDDMKTSEKDLQLDDDMKTFMSLLTHHWHDICSNEKMFENNAHGKIVRELYKKWSNRFFYEEVLRVIKHPPFKPPKPSPVLHLALGLLRDLRYSLAMGGTCENGTSGDVESELGNRGDVTVKNDTVNDDVTVGTNSSESSAARGKCVKYKLLRIHMTFQDKNRRKKASLAYLCNGVPKFRQRSASNAGPGCVPVSCCSLS